MTEQMLLPTGSVIRTVTGLELKLRAPLAASETADPTVLTVTLSGQMEVVNVVKLGQMSAAQWRRYYATAR